MAGDLGPRSTCLTLSLPPPAPSPSPSHLRSPCLYHTQLVVLVTVVVLVVLCPRLKERSLCLARHPPTPPKAEPCLLSPPSLAICHHPATLSARLRPETLPTSRLASFPTHYFSRRATQRTVQPRNARSTKYLTPSLTRPEPSTALAHPRRLPLTSAYPSAALSSIFPFSVAVLGPIYPSTYITLPTRQPANRPSSRLLASTTPHSDTSATSSLDHAAALSRALTAIEHRTPSPPPLLLPHTTHHTPHTNRQHGQA